MKKSYVLPNLFFSKRRSSLLIGVLLLGGCANIPEKLQLDDNVPLVSYNDVRPNADIGLNARWGGIIAKVENQKHRTMIEVVDFNLSRSSRPKITNETQGRFRLYYKGLLDPVIYKKGKTITVIGTITNPEKGLIGKQKYFYPVIKAKNVHLWKDINRTNSQSLYDPFLSSPFYWGGSPFYYPGSFGYGYAYQGLGHSYQSLGQSHQGMSNVHSANVQHK